MKRRFSTRWAAPALLALLAIPSLLGCSGGAPEVPDAPTVLVAAKTPPPISGGTLAVSSQGLAVAADPDRDRVYVVDLDTRHVTEIALHDGDEPGRVALGPAGVAFVALRSGGAVVTIDTTKGAVASRTQVCPAPRGLAYDAATQLLHVACVGGELVSLDASTGKEVRRLRLDRDLRDVVVSGDRLLVSRFRSAQLLAINAAGNVVTSVRPANFQSPSFKQESEPEVAWRTIGLPDGRVAMVHQRAVETPVVIEEGGYAGGGCDGSVVDGTVTVIETSDNPLAPLAEPIAAGSLPSAILPVDVAVSPDGTRIAVASAGNDLVMQAFVGDIEFSGMDDCGSLYMPEVTPGEPIAVGFAPDQRLVVQTREPATLRLPGDPGDGVIALSQTSVADTGHDMFHKNPGGLSALACASCHPEGGDDGRVWNFDPIGARRTQNLRGGVMSTAPFHWDGDMANLGAIMDEVFVKRMGGQGLGPRHVRAFGTWLNAIPLLPDSAPEDTAAVDRGQALFQDPSVGCTTCHSGATFTNNATVDVGTGRGVAQAFQVSSLVGVRWRAPYLHDGQAATLEDRFGPAGGGDQHGHTSQLTAEQIHDLVSYLETL